MNPGSLVLPLLMALLIPVAGRADLPDVSDGTGESRFQEAFHLAGGDARRAAPARAIGPERR